MRDKTRKKTQPSTRHPMLKTLRMRKKRTGNLTSSIVYRPGQKGLNGLLNSSATFKDKRKRKARLIYSSSGFHVIMRESRSKLNPPTPKEKVRELPEKNSSNESFSAVISVNKGKKLETNICSSISSQQSRVKCAKKRKSDLGPSVLSDSDLPALFNKYNLGPKYSPFVSLKDCLGIKKLKRKSSSSGMNKNSSSTNFENDNDEPHFKKPKKDEQYEVERIVTHFKNKSKFFYCLKWKGFSEAENTYEPTEKLINCNFLLMNYFGGDKVSGSKIRSIKIEVEKASKVIANYEKLFKIKLSELKLTAIANDVANVDQIFSGELDNFYLRLKEEYGYLLRCLAAMGDNRDSNLFRRAINYKLCIMIAEKRYQQLSILKSQEERINRKEICPVRLENNTDLQHLPDYFIYVTDLMPTKGVNVPYDPTVGCACKNGCSSTSNCCGKLAGFNFAYNSKRRLIAKGISPIYECNWRCRCPLTCPNRVVQRGRNIQLCIFRTENCGWGLKTLENIEKGQFVCEYVGELVTEKEASSRTSKYSNQCVYIFNLDFNDERNHAYCIDSTIYGNASRFINSSCEPNLVVYPVWINCMASNLFRIAFFAKRNIRENEELYFDYAIASDPMADANGRRNKRLTQKFQRQECYCESPKCRGWIFSN